MLNDEACVHFFSIKKMDNALTLLRGFAEKQGNKIQRQIIAAQIEIMRAGKLAVIYNHFESLKPSILKNKMVFDNEMLVSVRDVSHLAQSTSFLFLHFLNNLKFLAESIASKENEPYFYYLVEHAIPSCFGFYTTQELLNYATTFYYNVILSTKSRLGYRILNPIFHSCVTFRFLEALFTRFFKRLTVLLHNNPLLPDEMKIETAIIFLYEAITFTFPLLPNQFYFLIKTIFSSKWNIKGFYFYFFKGFLLPKAIIWCRSSPIHDFEPIIVSMFKQLQYEEEFHSQLQRVLNTTSSSFYMARLLSFPSRSYLQFETTFRSAYRIAQYLNDLKMFPDAIDFVEFNPISNENLDKWYKIQLYFPQPTQPPKTYMSLFDSDQNEEKIFDNLIKNTLLVSRLTEFKAVSSLFSSMTKNHYYHDCTQVEVEKPLVTELDSPFLLQHMFIQRVATEKIVKLETLAAISNHINSQWIKTVASQQQYDYNDYIYRFGDTIKLEIIECISYLQCIDTASLADQYGLVVSVFDTLDTIGNHYHENGIFDFVFQQSKCQTFLSTFLILNSFAMWDKKFAEYCSEREKHVWSKLEHKILQILMTDQTFLAAFVKIQEDFDKMV